MYGNEQRGAVIGAYRPEAATQLAAMQLASSPHARDREPDVSRALNELNRNVDYLSEQLSSLGSRLTSLMSPAMNAQGAATPAPCELSGCEMSGILRETSNRIADQLARIADMLARLEV